MTPQEIFNKAFTGVVKQNGPSVRPGTSLKNSTVCAYRGENGFACGVGHLVDDETAREWDMIGSISDVFRDLEDDLPPWVIDNIMLLEEIQTAHDRAYEETRNDDDFIPTFVSWMRAIATRQHLTVPSHGLDHASV